MDRPEYVRGRPHRALSGAVIDYGGYVEAGTETVRRRQAPVGSATLILSFGPPLRLFGPAGPTAPGSFVAGLHDAVVVTEFVGLQRGVQVNLTPLGAFTLLGRPMADLTNRVPRLDELGLPELAALPQRLAEDRCWPERFARIDRVLMALLGAARRRPDPEVAWAWRELRRSGGTLGVARLAEGTGWSRRHLLTRFRAQVGLGPKAAARVLRFEHAAGLLVPMRADGGPSAGTDATLAEVAAVCGYADQAHLARDFRALAGVSASRYRAEWT